MTYAVGLERPVNNSYLYRGKGYVLAVGRAAEAQNTEHLIIISSVMLFVLGVSSVYRWFRSLVKDGLPNRTSLIELTELLTKLVKISIFQINFT